jgi:arylsulfatase A-like enzyme
MDRRTFLKNAATTGRALAVAGLLGNQSQALQSVAPGRHGGPPPNILFILVDELRFWRVFPKGINNVGEFLREFMPNTYQSLWVPGVKFAGHYTAGTACTPARGTLITGLYTQQSWLLATILDSPTTTVSEQPVLNRAYPTYGKLLQQAGYQTPYIGKWHLSIPHRGPDELLNAYGFEGMTDPDPVGNNLQGTIGNLAQQPGYLSDSQIASQAVNWLQERQPGEAPWCLTVGFINPHDKQFFPAGTEFQTVTNLFNSPSSNPDELAQFINYTAGPPTYDYDMDPLKSPPSLDYPAIPPNWESADQIAKNKPSTQTYARLFQQAVFGGASDDSSATDFSIVEYPTNPTFPPLKQPLGVVEAPFSYWQRGLDSYTQIMTILDQNIGLVLDALPPQVASNTVIVLTSDHGEYAGAHGFVSGKVGSCYEEVYNVPLIVFDPSGRFTGDIEEIRTGLTSSVDILPLLVSLGYNGSQRWMTGDLAQIYAPRHNILPMLKSARAPGRPYVVFADDDPSPQLYNFNSSPGRIIGLRTPVAKLGVYADWVPGTTDIAPRTIQLEYYDYTTPGGLLETDNRNDDPAAQLLLTALLTDVLPNELRAPLPAGFVPAQTIAKIEYLGYVDVVNALATREDTVAVLPITVGDI